MIGSRGTYKVVQVPVGTVIHVVEGELPSAVQKTSSTTLAPWDILGTLSVPIPSQSLPPYPNVVKLTVPGQQIIVAEGGEGGFGNLSTGKTASSSTGSMGSTGSTGSEVVLVLELKSIADVGLVGVPNAGKSTQKMTRPKMNMKVLKKS